MKQATFHQMMRAGKKLPHPVPPPPPPPPTPAGLTINLSFDASCSSAPAGFQDVVHKVAADIMARFNNPCTVNINIGWGEYAGMPLPSGALASTDFNYQFTTYAALTAALKSKAVTANDNLAVSFIPASDPSGGQQWYVTNAQAKALGLLAPTAAGIDAYIGFSTTATWDFNNTDGVNGYDIYGTCSHEMTEALGRVWAQGYSSVYNLMCYSAPGQLSFTGTAYRYFSIDGGVTALNTFNSNPGGDFGDWRGDTVDAANAFGTTGIIMPVSEADLIALDVVGWRRV
jgi:hypothetical protein